MLWGDFLGDPTGVQRKGGRYWAGVDYAVGGDGKNVEIMRWFSKAKKKKIESKEREN